MGGKPVAKTSLQRLKAEHLIFIREILHGATKTAAAISAGISEELAPQTALDWTRNAVVTAEYKRQKALPWYIAVPTRERTIEEIGKIAFSNIRDVFEEDEDGKIIPKKLSEMPEHVSALIASIKITEGMFATTTEYKLWPKMDALDMLGKMHGLFEKDNAQKRADVNIRITANDGQPKELPSINTSDFEIIEEAD